jgi:hypothetical protein
VNAGLPENLQDFRWCEEPNCNTIVPADDQAVGGADAVRRPGAWIIGCQTGSHIVRGLLGEEDAHEFE